MNFSSFGYKCRFFLVKTGLLISVILLNSGLLAQNKPVKSEKLFWKEDFSAGRLPEGWTNKALNDSSILWECTNQPFPGSYGRDQQAPPIASKSGGFHMQYASGTRVEKAYRKWEKAGIWPDAFFQTPAIDCSKKGSVVLKFQQNFMWNDWGKLRKDGGLFVCVSNNGTDWKEYEVRNGIGSEADCPNPMNVELNLTSVAAFQPRVYLRFQWRGIYAWYWMVDDIELSEALDVDVAASALVSHPKSGNKFTNTDVFKFNVVNLSSGAIRKPFDCYLRIDNRPEIKVTVPFDEKNVLKIVDTVVVAFPPADLTDYGIHKIKFYTSLAGDNRRTNGHNLAATERAEGFSISVGCLVERAGFEPA